MIFFLLYDEDCKHLNEKETKSKGSVDERTAYLFEGGQCHQVNSGQPLWVRITCDAKGFHEDIYTDATCTTKYVDDFIGDASFSLPWNICKSMYGQGFIAITS